MPIITISRGSLSGGRELAEKTAAKLGCRCVHNEVIMEAANKYNIPQLQMAEVFEKTPGFWDRFTESKRVYLILIKAVMCELAEKGNLVYHGYGGQELLRGVSHVLKVRLIAPMKYRIRMFKMSPQNQGISDEEAAKRIMKIDEERTKRMKYLLDIDWRDPSLYDLIINLENMSTDTASDLLVYMVGQKEFTTTEESAAALRNVSLASRVKAALAIHPATSRASITVTADDGAVTLSGSISSPSMEKEILSVVEGMEGVKSVNNLLMLNPGYQTMPWT